MEVLTLDTAINSVPKISKIHKVLESSVTFPGYRIVDLDISQGHPNIGSLVKMPAIYSLTSKT